MVLLQVSSGDKTEGKQGKSDFWALKTDSNGIKEWDLTFGGSGDEKLHSVSQTMDGGYLLGGHTFSGANGDISQPNQGISDYWIVKLQGTGLLQEFFADADNDGYGNPAIDTFAYSSACGICNRQRRLQRLKHQCTSGSIDICKRH
jgi:hypothetical protein